MPKTPSKKTLTAKLDNAARAYCKSHAGEKCQARGEAGLRCSQRLEWCHLKSRGIKIVRWNPDNALCMCNVHHRYFTQHPDRWYEFVEKKYPGRWDELNKIANSGQKPDYGYWLEYYGL